MSALRIIFAGTPDFACPSLRALAKAGHELVLVLTQPDRPRGRGQHLAAPAVKMAAQELGLMVMQPAKLDTPEFRRIIEDLAPDAAIVVAYGQLIPAWFLGFPRLGCLNVHGSLLPRYRGAAPIQRALMAGETVTGVTIMQLDAGWDTGPTLSAASVEIGAAEDAGSLHDRLAEVGAELLVPTLRAFATGEIAPVPQEEASATRAPKIRPEEASLDWRLPAAKLHNLIRALSPVPLAETFQGDLRLQIIRAEVAAGSGEDLPGTLIRVEADGVLVRAGEGALLLQEVKPANGRRMSAADFARGRRLGPGARFGPTQD